MSRSRASATKAQTAPMTMASAEIGRTRSVVVKSPRAAQDWLRKSVPGWPFTPDIFPLPRKVAPFLFVPNAEGIDKSSAAAC